MKRTIAKAALVAMGIALSLPAISRYAQLEASGYVVLCGFNGEIECQPGGNSDCQQEA